MPGPGGRPPGKLPQTTPWSSGRPTWASLEAGSANPTLGVLARTAARLFRVGEWPERKRQGATIRPPIPESIPGLEIVRMQLAPGDALVFRGDQRHSYRNLDARRPAVAISVVCFAVSAG